METLKQSAITAISQLPDTANIDDIVVVLYQIRRREKEAVNQTEAKPVSCYDLAKDYIGCIEGPEDLSTNKAYMAGFGL